MVSYWVGEGQTAIWVVDETGLVKSATVRVTRARIAALARLAGGIDPVAPGSVAQWRELYDLLIQPVRAALPAGRGGLLTIVPHGGLFRIPFAALLAPDGRYLLEDFQASLCSIWRSPRLHRRRRHAAHTGLDDLRTGCQPVAGATTWGAASASGCSPEIRAIAREAPSGAAVVLDG